MKKILILFCAALALGFQACSNDNDELWDAVDELKNRVQALETQVEALNGNIEALQALLRDGATISDVRMADGKYLLTLSNGEVIELVQGRDSEAVIPVVGISDSGEWQVSTDGGTTYTSLGVQASADGAVTPRFRIDEATGCWQVSYDGGATFADVLDTNGKPVRAVGSGTGEDKFFDAVEVRDDVLYVKLLDGTELEVPIVVGFTCKIAAPEGVQTFAAGETKRFALTLSGVDQTLVTAPAGWIARIETSESSSWLVVTAPGGAATRAAADSSQDVAILATAGKYACIAKIRVEVDAASVPEPVVDYYVEGVTIDGTTYDRNTPGAVLVTESTAITNAGGSVYFLDPKDSSVEITLAGSGANGFSELVLVGRYGNAKPVVTLTNVVSLKDSGAGFFFKNVKIDGSAWTNYLFNVNGSGTFDRVALEDCEVELAPDRALCYCSTGTVREWSVRNTKIHVNVSDAGKTGIHVFSFTTGFTVASRFELVNNIVYCSTPTRGGFVNNIGASAMDMTVSRNTFVNYLGVNAFVVFNGARTCDLTKNLFWSEPLSATAYLVRSNTATDVEIDLDNCLYGGGSWVAFSQIGNLTRYESSPAVSVESVDPFAGGTFELDQGIFIPAPAYADCGSTLK